MSLFWITLAATVLGTAAGTICSLMPSLHIYNVAGIALLLWTYFGDKVEYAALAPFFIAMIVAFSFLNAIPMTFFGAPDESATVTILPGTKYLMTGKGHEAVVLSGIGGLCGVALLALLTPFFFYIFPYMHSIMSVHMHWILGLVMVYMLMSEWPKGCGLGHTALEKLKNAWGNLFAGIITFGLSAILGLIITSKSIITHEMGFQNIMPVFVGLFAIPSIVQSLLSNQKVPKQHVGESIELTTGEIAKSSFSGVLGGMLAAYLPAVTAGIGGILAGHATAQRGDRIFILGGGVAKVIYYVGACLFVLFLTPVCAHRLGKGGLNIILKPVFSPAPGDYPLMLAVIILSGCLSFLLLLKASARVAKMMEKVNLRDLYWAALVLVVAIVGSLTGFNGLFVLAVASCIGSIPVFYHCRRSNCMAVLLVPICLNMAGYGAAIAALLGLA